MSKRGCYVPHHLFSAEILPSQPIDSQILVWQTNGAPAQSTNWVQRFPPETTPLLLDYEEFHHRPPKSGKNVVFMGGHVAALEMSFD